MIEPFICWTFSVVLKKCLVSVFCGLYYGHYKHITPHTYISSHITNINSFYLLCLLRINKRILQWISVAVVILHPNHQLTYPFCLSLTMWLVFHVFFFFFVLFHRYQSQHGIFVPSFPKSKVLLSQILYGKIRMALIKLKRTEPRRVITTVLSMNKYIHSERMKGKKK